MDPRRPARPHYAWIILAVTCLTVVMTARFTAGVLTGGVGKFRPQPLGTCTAAITDMAGTHVGGL
jgi:hypothetical protein